MSAVSVCVIITVLTSIIVNFIRYRDVLYPPVIQGSIWAFVIVMYCREENTLPRISEFSYFILVSGVLIFSIGSYIATWAHSVKVKPVGIEHLRVRKFVAGLLFWLSICGLPLFVRKGYLLGTGGPTNSFFMNLRGAVTGIYEGGGYGLFGYFVTISFLSAWMQLLIQLEERNRVKLVMAYGFALVYALFSTGRTFFMLLFVTTCGILMISRKVSWKKTGLVFSLVGLSMFVGVAILLGKGGSVESEPSEIMDSMLEMFKVYLIGSLAAFDTLVRGDSAAELGLNSFRTIFVILNKFDHEIVPVPLVQEFVFAPMQTNVYTLYQPYYRDFLGVGAIGIQFILGVWHGFLYKRATLGRKEYVFLYSLFLYPLVMQFFEDQYLSLLSTWIQYVSISVLCFYRIKIVSKTGERSGEC